MIVGYAWPRLELDERFYWGVEGIPQADGGTSIRGMHFSRYRPVQFEDA